MNIAKKQALQRCGGHQTCINESHRRCAEEVGLGFKGLDIKSHLHTLVWSEPLQLFWSGLERMWLHKEKG